MTGCSESTTGTGLYSEFLCSSALCRLASTPGHQCQHPVMLPAVQMGSFFVEQGAVMDRIVVWRGHRELDIPAASLSVFNTLSIIVLIPIYDRGLVPLLRRLGCRISHLQRIGARMRLWWICSCD